MRARLGLIGIALVLGACQPAGYTPDYEFGFMQACEAGQDVPGLCACTWGKIEANVARADFDALERMSPMEREASPIQQQIQTYALECIAETATAP